MKLETSQRAHCDSSTGGLQLSAISLVEELLALDGVSFQGLHVRYDVTVP